MEAIIRRTIFLFLLPFLIGGCKKDDKEVNGNIEANKQLLNVMNKYYYWYDRMPMANPEDFQDPAELLEAIRVFPPDKWSYVTTKQELEAYFNEGTYYGLGYGAAFDISGNLWIIYVFKSSPLYSKGIGRGWKISTIDGVIPTPENYNQLMGPNESGISKTIGFESPTGSMISYTFTKSAVVINTVLFDSIYSISSKKIAYMVLNGFITPTNSELDKSFSRYKANTIDELIVDLRYNGGGSIDVSNYLASLIGGSKANGGIYATFYHNSKNKDRDTSILFSTPSNTISLSRVVFITTEGTASASELLINGLKPYMPVCLVGTKTHGKPVGMYAFEYKEFDWAFVPICFSLRNANNEGDFFEGIGVDVQVTDDYTRSFGDVNENSFAAALSYLGVSPKKCYGVKSKTALQSTLVKGKGLYEEIGAW